MQTIRDKKSARKLILPTEEENDAINAGIAADADTFEPTNEQFKQFRRIGRPKADITKDRVTIRLSPMVTKYFRDSGKGWQTRIDKVLQEYVKSH